MKEDCVKVYLKINVIFYKKKRKVQKNSHKLNIKYYN